MSVQMFSQDMSLPQNAFRPHWLWRDLRAIVEHPLELLCHMFETQGAMARFDLPAFSFQKATLVADPDWVKRILVDESESYSKDTRAFQVTKMLIGDGLITSQGDRWKRHRRLVQPAFHRQWYPSFCDAVTEATAGLLERIEAAAQNGESIDLYGAAMQLTLDVVCRALLDIDLTGRAGDVERAMRTLMEVSMHLNGVIAVPPRWVPTALNRRANAALKEVRGAAREAAVRARHRLKTNPPRNLVETLVAAESAGLSQEDIESEILTILLAGHETTAIAVAWALHFVSRDPGVDTTLGREAAALDGRAARFDDLAKLPYAKQVVQETMRLMPPVWAYTRRARRADEFQGWKVAAGEQMIVSPFLVHRHPDHWARPYTFDPDRFSREADRKRHTAAYFPFGAGPRTCIGNMFAMMEAQIVLASLAGRFRFERVGDEPFRVLPSTTLRPDFALRFIPRRRQP